METPHMEKRQIIFKEANIARSILETLKTGKHVWDTKGDEPETLEKRLMQLLHFRQYSLMYKYAFHNWELDSLEQTYIEVANEARDLHNLVEDNVYKDTLTTLFVLKSEQENKTIEEINEIYMNKIGKMWKEAGLIGGGP